MPQHAQGWCTTVSMQATFGWGELYALLLAIDRAEEIRDTISGAPFQVLCSIAHAGLTHD